MPRSEQYQYNGDVPTLTGGRTAAAGQTAPQSLEDVVLAVDPLSNPQPAPVSPVLQPGHPTGPVGTTPYVSRPLLARRVAAILVGVLTIKVVAVWLDFDHAIMVWLLFAIFVALWPSWPQPTAGEKRAQAWPYWSADQ